MGKVKQLITNVRVTILILSLLLALFAIHLSLNREGVAISAVATNSSASFAGIHSLSSNSFNV